ncbi:hypothetical protein ATO1_25360 [Phaeobacter sp. 22II1-1F12B]|nr:hypothetical protein ATO1_25360 [Phaeobacter sp. 22II1-1F12B]
MEDSTSEVSYADLSAIRLTCRVFVATAKQSGRKGGEPSFAARERLFGWLCKLKFNQACRLKPNVVDERREGDP